MSAAISLWLRAFWQDQQFTPERLKCVLRIVLSSVITLIAMLVWQMPFLSLGLYVLFFVLRESPVLSFRFSILILLSVVAAVAIELGIVILTGNDPTARVLSVAAISFFCGIMIQACMVPFLFVGLGFIFCTLIATWELHAPADHLVKSSLWLIATVACTLGSSVAVEHIFGVRNPAEELQKHIVKRFRALEKVFRLYAEGNTGAEWLAAATQVAQLAAGGRSDMQELYETIVSRGLDPGELGVGTRVKITMLVQLLDLAAAAIAHPQEQVNEVTRRRCAIIAANCRALAECTPNSDCGAGGLRRPAIVSSNLDRIEEALHSLLELPLNQHPLADKELAALPQKKVSFIRKEALTSMDSVLFGLKISLCATLCYIFYFAVDWPGISTCCGTVLIVGLSNTGAMKQKFSYRLIGSAIGGVLGLAVESLVLPYVDTITPVVIIVGLLAFVAAWIALGRRFSYVGLQIAFSFYLVAFSGPHAPTLLAPARDRLVGILIALFVMWVVFDQVWPVRTVSVMRKSLASALRNASGVFHVSTLGADRKELLRKADNLRHQFGMTVATLQSLNDSVKYEFGTDRNAQIREGETIFRSVLAAISLFWNELVVLHAAENTRIINEAELMEMRRMLAHHLSRMADAVSHEQPIPRAVPLESVSATVLESPQYGSYVRSVLARFDELQAVAYELNPQDVAVTALVGRPADVGE